MLTAVTPFKRYTVGQRSSALLEQFARGSGAALLHHSPNDGARTIGGSTAVYVSCLTRLTILPAALRWKWWTRRSGTGSKCGEAEKRRNATGEGDGKDAQGNPLGDMPFTLKRGDGLPDQTKNTLPVAVMRWLRRLDQ